MAVALLKVTSEIFMASSNTFFSGFTFCGTLFCCHSGNGCHLLGFPWSGSLGCPPISSTILSLLTLPILVALKFPPKPYLPSVHYLQNIFSILMVSVSPGKILKSPSTIPSFFELWWQTPDSRVPWGLPLASLLALHKSTLLTVLSAAVRFLLSYLKTFSGSLWLPRKGTLLTVVFRTSAVQLSGSPSSNSWALPSEKPMLWQNSLTFVISQTCFPVFLSGNLFSPSGILEKKNHTELKETLEIIPPLTHFTDAEKDTWVRWPAQGHKIYELQIICLGHRSRCVLSAAHHAPLRGC